MFDHDLYFTSCLHAVQARRVTATLYRRGAVVVGWPRVGWAAPAAPKPPRGIVRSQSARSLIRASFAVSNAEAEWSWMLTLTFREKHPSAKNCLRQLMSAIWPCWNSEFRIVWWQEYQGRGVVHYHLLGDAEALRHLNCGDAPEWVSVGRGRTTRTVLGGRQGESLARLWVGITGDSSEEALAFNRGGILESLGDPEQAARYVASYVKKVSQKTLPDDEVPQGNWWYISDLAQPVSRGTVTVEDWPFASPHKLVFDAAKLTRKEVIEHERATRTDAGGPGGATGGGPGGSHRRQAGGKTSLGGPIDPDDRRQVRRYRLRA